MKNMIYYSIAAVSLLASYAYGASGGGWVDSVANLSNRAIVESVSRSETLTTEYVVDPSSQIVLLPSGEGWEALSFSDLSNRTSLPETPSDTMLIRAKIATKVHEYSVHVFGKDVPFAFSSKDNAVGFWNGADWIIVAASDL